MRLKVNGTSFTLWASASDTEEWATRPVAVWPCSQLRGHRFVASFDTNGLCDLTIDGRDDADVDADELSACVADLAGSRLPSDHPCWFVAVGQFR